MRRTLPGEVVPLHDTLEVVRQGWEWMLLVVLFEQDGELRGRSNSTLHADGEVIRDSAPLSHGTVITGEDLRFRVEQMD